MNFIQEDLIQSLHKDLTSRLDEINVEYYDLWTNPEILYKGLSPTAAVIFSNGSSLELPTNPTIYKYLDCIGMHNSRERQAFNSSSFYYKLCFYRHELINPDQLIQAVYYQVVPNFLSNISNLHDNILFLHSYNVQMHELIDLSESELIFAINALVLPKKEFYNFIDKYHRKYSGIFYD